MAASRLLAGVLTWAVHGGAFHVDHYDEHRRLRRVEYNPNVKAPEVSVHYNTPSGRRLDWHDAGGPGTDGYLPNSETPDVTLMVVNPDELYIHTTDNSITIYGTDVTLDEYMWNVDKDLTVMAGRIRLPSRLRLNSKPEWTGELRMLYLQAMEVVVPADGAIIDVSGDAGITPSDGMDADHGVDAGDAGSDGEDGGTGGPGGVVKIQAGEIYGGLLTINVDGGPGGNGQNGGDGAVGAVGERRTDIDDCCNAKTGQTGNTGGAGGDAGFGGSGGQGGQAGFADVQVARPLNATMTNLPLSTVLIQAQPGMGGAAGLAGRNGPGGAGGPGLPTKCKSIDIFWWNKFCTFPIGDYGEVGPNGTEAEAGAPGKYGIESASGVSVVSEKSLHELRAIGAGQNLRYELFWADKLYRSAMYVEAQKTYVWIEAVLHTNHTNETGIESVPWKQIGLEAAVRLTQLKSGLDFWGRQLNHAPLVSFNALHDNVVNLLSIAKDAEDAYDTYYAEGTSEIERKNLITKGLKNIDYEIALTEVELSETKTAIETLRTDILQLQADQDMWLQLVMNGAEECDAGITEYEASVNSGFTASLKSLSTLATNGIALWGTVAAAATVGLGVWALMATSVPTVVNSVVNVATSSGGNLQTVLNTGMTDTLPLVQTLITDTQTKQTEITDSYGSFTAAIETIQTDASSEATRVDGIRTQTNVAITMEEFLTIRTEYIDTIPECAPVRDDYTYLYAVSQELQSKLTEHDMYVVQFASSTVARSTLAQTRDDLLNSVVGTFDPTALQFMQSIGNSYRTQKDRIIEMLKMLHDAVDFEFCEQNPFQYEDVRVAQLSSFLAQISTERMRKLAEDSGSRGVLEARGANGQATAVVKISLTPTLSDDMALAFNNFWENGTLIYHLDMDNAALPSGVANLRVVDAQAFVPALLLDEFGTSDLAEVWMRKLGSSTCMNTAGKQQLFSHAASSYYSVYSAKVDPRLTDESPTWLTQPTPPVESSAGPTPVGTWQVSVPSLNTMALRQQVQEVEIHLIVSYVPCSMPSCGSSTTQASSLMSLHSSKPSPTTAGLTTSLSLCGAAVIGSLLTMSAVFGINRRATRRATLASPRTDESELRATQ